MTPDLMFIIGIIICCTALAGTIVTVIILRIFKVRLEKQLNTEYGKRRR